MRIYIFAFKLWYMAWTCEMKKKIFFSFLKKTFLNTKSYLFFLFGLHSRKNMEPPGGRITILTIKFPHIKLLVI